MATELHFLTAEIQTALCHKLDLPKITEQNRVKLQYKQYFGTVM